MQDVRVPVAELELAYQRWKLQWPHKETCKWTEFMGHVSTTSDRDGYWSSEQGYHRIMALAGPHWKTMLKVWSIQHREDLNRKYKNAKHNL